MKLFDSREDDCEFGHAYQAYWERRNRDSLRQQMERENRKTIVRLNKLSNKRIRTLAKDVSHPKEDEMDVDDQGEGYLNADDQGEGYLNADDQGESHLNADDDYREKTSNALKQISALPSDEVGHLKIIDLSSESALRILQSEISEDEFNNITNATHIEPIVLSDYATELSNALQHCPLSPSVLRDTLYSNGFKKGFDSVVHSDAAFIEVATRHFLDLMSSPRNPLNQRVLERTAATFFIIFIVNQLFISNNDVIELDWLEREFFATDKAKWDGVLIKVENRSCSAGLIEFSGGCNDQTSGTKNQRDITKLYSKLMKVLDGQSSSAARQTFCMRYYNKRIHFEKLIIYKKMLFRIIHATIETPTSPRKLVEFVKEIPNMLAWKEAVVEHTVEL
ncbi:hypothetical protein CU098_006074 [Rhizopus stolonifer]|uniref:Uncharacterized protein n=1 Tax=Rhizopus stolonifer TaxID=4846 RepID=A0A367J0F2_RHIST|nr:hypothetical protein CU098_006074 [Rhizopus stolonifer]